MIKKLAGCIGEYKRSAILSPIFISLEVVMEVLIPIVMASLIDKGIEAGNISEIWRIGIMLAVIAIFSLLFGVIAGSCAAKASCGFAKNLRKKLYYSVQNFSFCNIDRFSTPSLITRMTTDVTNVQNSFQMIIRVAVRCPIMLIFALIMSFRINRSLALIFVAVVPVMMMGLAFVFKNAHPVFERVFRKYDTLNNVVQENLRGIRVVKSFVREDYEEKKFFQTSEEIYKDFTKAEKLIAINRPIMQTSVSLCMVLVAWIGARLVIGSAMTTGQLMSLFSYVMQILMSLMMLSMVFVIITISKSSAERIIEVLDETSDIQNPENPVYDVKNGDVLFKNVSFSYTGSMDKLCLSDINLNIKSGETVGIIGGTGSSKSSLVQLISRLYDVTEGELLVGDVNVKDYDIRTLRDNVAVVLQKNVLFSGTIKENLRWGNRDATDEQLVNACKLAQADEFINKFPDKYDTYIEQGGANVSGGQRQRLCIARALLKNPKILILDDSTSAVDTATDTLIRKAFIEQIPHITKIIIAQRIGSVMDADKIIVMDGGRINGIGTHEQLIKSNEIYKEVYASQMKGEIAE